ncbi:hypothetical protein CORC01_10958 [Colletotrichum orchidophilum]|uniref:Protein kinase domain-containing protein n=1 Tax=Colletotrichum orchidophilum TaxID=1209926 RepID=A0A1G4AX74_9PEZI|nr:uncharacterized protein CORC01_10958 [Colletotrichum orchidophilum]OHE93731.1 hypothetical protein CORC01_10958 [Colletotrichum orchidophilum]
MSQNPRIIDQTQMVVNKYAPQTAEEPQPGSIQESEEEKKNRRRKLVNAITAKMANVRGEQFPQYDEDGLVLPHPFGRAAQHVQGPTHKFASRYFDSSAVDDAQAKYGGQKNPKGYNIRLQKVLGAGGYGIAAYISHTNPVNKFKTDCVIKVEKYRHNDRATLAREEKALWKFKGAKHILQILDISHEIKTQRAADFAAWQQGRPERPKGARVPNPENQDKNWSLKNFQNQPVRNFVIVEHANRGDLSIWLGKSSRLGQRWPQRAIWMLLQNLISGLVGMGYPLREHYQESHPDWDINNPIDEQFPDDPNFELQETVHFDLDPKNVFLANRSMAYGNMPTFKIADFGMVEFFSEQATDPEHFNKEFFWKSRIKGKPSCYAPEQFTGDWELMNDFINDNGINPFVVKDATKPPVAGNYGMHTNVYQVGVIIWCATTLCSFHTPVIRMTHKDAWGREIDTYGGALQNERFNDVDPELKDLVQRCMAHNPSDRPSLRELMGTISARLGRDDLESDEALSEWSREFFSNHRTPGDEPPPLAKREREDDEGDDGDHAERKATRRKVVDGNGNVIRQNIPRGEPLLFSSFQPPNHHPSMQVNNRLGSKFNNSPNVQGFPPRMPASGVVQRPLSGAAGPAVFNWDDPPPPFDARIYQGPPANWQPRMPVAQFNNSNTYNKYNSTAMNPAAPSNLPVFYGENQGAGMIPGNGYYPPGEFGPVASQPLLNIHPPPPQNMQSMYPQPGSQRAQEQYAPASQPQPLQSLYPLEPQPQPQHQQQQQQNHYYPEVDPAQRPQFGIQSPNQESRHQHLSQQQQEEVPQNMNNFFDFDNAGADGFQFDAMDQGA